MRIALLICIIGLFAGCKATNSLIFHPLHKVYEQHEYNEQYEKPPSTNNIENP
jgi:hypothetical protein